MESEEDGASQSKKRSNVELDARDSWLASVRTPQKKSKNTVDMISVLNQGSVDIGDDCWNLIFWRLDKLHDQLSLSSTCKRLRRILFDMDHGWMLGYKILILVKKESSLRTSTDEELLFLDKTLKPLNRQSTLLQKRRQQEERKKEQMEFIRKNNITIEGIDNIKYEEKDFYDESDLIWLGGKGSFTIKNMKFKLTHKSYITSGGDDNRVFLQVYKDNNTICSREELQQALQGLPATKEELVHVFRCLAKKWLGGDDLESWDFEDFLTRSY